MAKYVYPAIFTKEAEGYSVCFPDVHNCYTSGATLPEAVEMAEDVLCLMLYRAEEQSNPLPPVSNPKTLQTKENEIVSLVACDTLEYRKLHDSRAVKKTLTIPSWLNKLAEQNNINFSSVLQSALKDMLQI
jgi:antitoxin HicB